MSHWIELKAADGHGFEAYVCEPQGQSEGSGEGASKGGGKGAQAVIHVSVSVIVGVCCVAPDSPNVTRRLLTPHAGPIKPV